MAKINRKEMWLRFAHIVVGSFDYRPTVASDVVPGAKLKMLHVRLTSPREPGAIPIQNTSGEVWHVRPEFNMQKIVMDNERPMGSATQILPYAVVAQYSCAPNNFRCFTDARNFTDAEIEIETSGLYLCTLYLASN